MYKKSTIELLIHFNKHHGAYMHKPFVIKKERKVQFKIQMCMCGFD